MGKKRSGFYRGYKRTKVLGDRGYVKPRKDGARYHKYSPNGKVHIDRHDPAKRPVRHVLKDYLGSGKK